MKIKNESQIELRTRTEVSQAKRDKSRKACMAGRLCGVDRDSREKEDKSERGMPGLLEAMKDVASCEKPRGAASRL